MANVQLAVAGDDTTQVILSVPGVQGPAGSNLPPSGTTNQVLYKQSNTDYDTGWSLVTSAMIASGTIVNEDVNASAAIAGTKISPNFGSQNVVTTGTSTAASFIPTSSGIPTNGMYLPSANNVAISTNGSGALFIDANGKVAVGNANPITTFQVGVNGTATASLRAAETYVSIDAGYQTAAANGTEANPCLIFGGDGDTGFWHPAANTIALSNNGSESLRITSTGELKHIGGGSEGSPSVYFAGSAPGNSLYVQATTGKVGLRTNNPSYELSFGTGTSNLVSVGTTDAALRLRADGARSLQLYTNGENRLHINSAGAVGIGTTTPGSSLHISDSATIQARLTSSGASTGILFSDAATTDSVTIGTVGDELRFRTDQGAYTFRTNNGASEAVRIDSSGRLLVGTSSDSGGADIQAANSLSVGGLIKREFSKELELSDNVETTYLTFSIPGGTLFTQSTNVGAEISYVITANRLSSSRSSRSTYGKVYVAIDRHWENSADNPVTVNLVDTDKALCSSTGAPTITWAASVEAGIDDAAKEVYIKITVDNPTAGSNLTVITGTVTYHTRVTGSSAVTVS